VVLTRIKILTQHLGGTKLTVTPLVVAALRDIRNYPHVQVSRLTATSVMRLVFQWIVEELEPQSNSFMSDWDCRRLKPTLLLFNFNRVGEASQPPSLTPPGIRFTYHGGSSC